MPRISWSDLQRLYDAELRVSGRSCTSQRHATRDRSFVAQRLSEGEGLAAFFRARLGDCSLRILDVGAGNGAVAIAAANDGHSVVTVDHVPNVDAKSLIAATDLAVAQIVATGVSLPFESDSFDVVLCLETIEHVRDAAAMGREIMRVLRPGGLCILTTPARVRFLLARDPHFGIAGLLLLPDRAQRWVVTRLLRIVPESQYDVVHIYWFASSIARLFPGHKDFQAVGTSPSNRILRRCWSFAQRWTWQRLVFSKNLHA